MRIMYINPTCALNEIYGHNTIVEKYSERSVRYHNAWSLQPHTTLFKRVYISAWLYWVIIIWIWTCLRSSSFDRASERARVDSEQDLQWRRPRVWALTTSRLLRFAISYGLKKILEPLVSRISPIELQFTSLEAKSNRITIDLDE